MSQCTVALGVGLMAFVFGARLPAEDAKDEAFPGPSHFGTHSTRGPLGVITSFSPVLTGFCPSATSSAGWGTWWPVFLPSALRSSPSPALLSIRMFPCLGRSHRIASTHCGTSFLGLLTSVLTR